MTLTTGTLARYADSACREGGLDERIYRDMAILVRERRTKLGMSQQQTADLSGLTRSSVASIETGRQSVAVHHVYALARALDLKPEDLLPPVQYGAAAPGSTAPRSVELFVASLTARPAIRRRGA